MKGIETRTPGGKAPTVDVSQSTYAPMKGIETPKMSWAAFQASGQSTYAPMKGIETLPWQSARRASYRWSEHVCPDEGD